MEKKPFVTKEQLDEITDNEDLSDPFSSLR